MKIEGLYNTAVVMTENIEEPAACRLNNCAIMVVGIISWK